MSYNLDVDKACFTIRAMNSSLSMVASDRLLATHFVDLEASLDAATIAERVLLVDALWGTRLFMEEGASDRIIHNLAQNSLRLQKLLIGLPADALTNYPDHVNEVAKGALRVILIQDPDQPEKYRKNYSFATKFIHWCTRSHFPIVDRWARERINAIQKEHNIRPIVRKQSPAGTDLCYINEYERWINFYSDLIYGLNGKACEQLIRVDHDSQPKAYRIINSILRILDKVFYWQGGGRSLGRVAN